MVLRLCVALALFGACLPDTEQLDTEVYEICYRGLEARVEPQPDGTGRGAVVVDDVDFGRATVDDPHIGLRTLRVDATEGVADLGFVDAAHIDVAELRILELAPERASLYGESPSPPDLLDLMTEQTLALTLTVEGAIPSSPWTVAIDACFDIDGVSLGL